MRRVAVFAGLVLDETENPTQVAYVGETPHYVVDDAGFARHIPAEAVDRQVLRAMQEQVLAQREAVVEGMLHFMQQDDLFTKAMIETSINKMEENMEQLFQTGLPDETKAWLGMMGFHITINVHGEVIDLNMPSGIAEE